MFCGRYEDRKSIIHPDPISSLTISLKKVDTRVRIDQFESMVKIKSCDKRNFLGVPAFNPKSIFNPLNKHKGLFHKDRSNHIDLLSKLKLFILT